MHPHGVLLWLPWVIGVLSLLVCGLLIAATMVAFLLDRYRPVRSPGLVPVPDDWLTDWELARIQERLAEPVWEPPDTEGELA